MMRETENGLLTEQEAADFFGWSVYTMREIRRRGDIEFLRFHDRTIRYTAEQLEAYKLRHMSHAAEAKEGADDGR